MAEKVFLSFSSSDELVQNCVNLWWWFLQNTAAFYTAQCTSPSFYFTTLKSHEAVQPGHSRIMASLAMSGLMTSPPVIWHHPNPVMRISSVVCLCMNHLATKQLLFSNLCAWRQGESVIHCWLSVWTEPGQWFLSQYYIYLLRKPMRTYLLLWDRCWLQLKHTPTARKKWPNKMYR